MPASPNDGPYPSPDRLHQLFDRALSLPPGERPGFVQQQAGDDPALVDQLLALLREVNADSAALQQLVHAGEDAGPPDHGGQGADPEPAAEPVHATATATLLAKLAQSPRLDQQRFVIEGLAGGGGMGVVHRVHDQHLNRRLALKVLRDRGPLQSERSRRELLGRFLEEAQVTAQLDHPGVVPVHELGLDQDGKVWFTMRLVKGRTASLVFADAFAQCAGWTLTRGLEVVLKVCDTMSYAHDKGVLHRDLKPQNVMVGRFGEVYVMDWGLAKVKGQADRRAARSAAEMEGLADDEEVASHRQRDAEEGGDSPYRSRRGSALGTPWYMSPEQARGEVAALDERTDVYAIGAMLYELVTGCMPYTTRQERPDPERALRAVLAGPPPAIETLQPGVAAELVAIVGKAMARDREQRYASAAALAGDLRAFLGSQVVSAYRTGALVELRLWVRRNKPLAASLAAAVLILVAGIAVSMIFANENAVLAQQKSDLAAEKGRTVDRFHQLSAVVRLEDAVAQQDALWPAWPDKIDALKAWLTGPCQQLLDQKPQIEATIAELRAKTLPWTSEQVETDRRASPSFPAYERQQQLVTSLRRAQAIRSGAEELVLPELSASLREADAEALHAFVWPRVAPEQPGGKEAQRTKFGEEDAALVAARVGVATCAGNPGESRALVSLAWAALANGQDQEARQRIEEAVAKANEKEREACLGHQREIEAAIAEATPRLASAEQALAELDSKVSVRRTWTFGGDEEGRSAQFLHKALVQVLAGLDSLAAKEKRDVEERLAWAEQVRQASLAHPRARVTWTQAREAIAKADGVVASQLYAGRSIPLPDHAVIGLVPIGMNPVTKLWEFYDLRSAWDGKQAATDIEIPTHKEDGKIEVQDGTGIVFVLLPGGEVTLGAQKSDPSGPYYDPDCFDYERVHVVYLDALLFSRYEMTQAQWHRMWTWDEFHRDPSEYKVGQLAAGRPVVGSDPVNNVDWPMCNRIVHRHGMALPTEAQWEYGSRAGTTTPWNCSFEDIPLFANLADESLKPYQPTWSTEAWSDGYAGHAPVGRLMPNKFGLHDVQGNVWEWCLEPYGNYGSERPGDGLRVEASSSHLCNRGGSFGSTATTARMALRNIRPSSFRNASLGLRPARDIPP